MKIGIFGGAFNPIHNGHLNLADIFYDALSLDKLLFIPTFKPPHKTDLHFADSEDRIKMLELALDGKPFEISTIEFQRQGKSYTYDTIVELNSFYPDSEFYLIIGSDQFLNFDKWYRYKDILNMVTLCSFSRSEDDSEREKMLSFAKVLTERHCIILDKSPVELSSSEIRQRIADGQSISMLVPEMVEKYILEKGLYGV